MVIANVLYYELASNHMYLELHYTKYMPTYRSNNTSDIYFLRCILECIIIQLDGFHITDWCRAF